MTILAKGNYVGLAMSLEWISIDFPEKCCLRGYALNAPLVYLGRDLCESLTKAGFDVKNWHAIAPKKSKWRKIIYDI